MVRELFDIEPDAWQLEALEMFPKSPRIAMCACKGPGKSTVLAWLSWNFLLTRPHPKVAATSISGDNLADGLWTEMAKWQGKSELLKAMFTWTKTRIFANDHPETWFMSARTWAKTADKQAQGNALAGLHADYILFVVDESGGIPDAVMVAAEAAFAGTIECHIVQAGNPTQLSGPLYRAATTSRDLWHVINITGDPDDPKRSPRIPIEYAREQIRQYGKDSPWVLVNIFGKFPPSSLNVLIGPDEVRESFERYYREHEIAAAARLLGVDVAREGDDQSVICRRQGLQVFPLKKYRNITGIQGAGQVARVWNDWQVDACFIDMTGGFGASWYDQLVTLKKSPISVLFSGQAMQSDRYYNKRTEMYFDLVEWIKRGGSLPESSEIMAALTQSEYSFKGDRLILEPKEMIKQKIGFSPDETDAICVTFAAPVSKTQPVAFGGRRREEQTYDPFAELSHVR